MADVSQQRADFVDALVWDPAVVVVTLRRPRSWSEWQWSIALIGGSIDYDRWVRRCSPAGSAAAGLDAIAAAADALPDLTVGAGSVLTPAAVDQVVDAGARFVVSPGLHVVPTLRRCRPRQSDRPPRPAVRSGGQRKLDGRPSPFPRRRSDRGHPRSAAAVATVRRARTG